MKKSIATLALIFSVLFSLESSQAMLIVKPAKQGIVRLELFFFAPATVVREIEIGNSYNFSLDISLDVSENLTRIVKLSETQFTLKPNETKTVEYTITVREPGSYSGDILVKTYSQGRSFVYQSSLLILARRKEFPIIPIVITVLVIILFLTLAWKKRVFKK